MWRKTRQALQLLRESSESGLNGSVDSGYDSTPDPGRSTSGRYEKMKLIGVSGELITVDVYRNINEEKMIYKSPDPLSKKPKGKQRNKRWSNAKNEDNNKKKSRDVSQSRRKRLFGPQITKTTPKKNIDQNVQKGCDESQKKITQKSMNSGGMRGRDDKSKLKIDGPKAEGKKEPDIETNTCVIDLIEEAFSDKIDISLAKKPSKEQSVIEKEPKVREAKTFFCFNNRDGVISTKPTIRRIIYND